MGLGSFETGTLSIEAIEEVGFICVAAPVSAASAAGKVMALLDGALSADAAQLKALLTGYQTLAAENAALRMEAMFWGAPCSERLDSGGTGG